MSDAARWVGACDTGIGCIVRQGLTAERKMLPPVLLYDARGSELFEAITRLPEYYVTRTERGILEEHSARVVEAATARATGPIALLELGAGSATKTVFLLAELLRARLDVTYFPADVSAAALRMAKEGLAAVLPRQRVRPLEASHERALDELARWPGTLVVLFLGSSIGNYDEDEAVALLARVRTAIGARGSLVLGVDRAKASEILVPAYDDAAGVTAAFNRNVLVRINRELGADFVPERFAHVAVWNEAAGAIEMHLESVIAQEVTLRALGLRVRFAAGERIHTESSHKYTDARLARLFAQAGIVSCGRAADAREWFSIEVARAALTHRGSGVWRPPSFAE
jgi:dimethylhistidine N-methyltransferase